MKTVPVFWGLAESNTLRMRLASLPKEVSALRTTDEEIPELEVEWVVPFRKYAALVFEGTMEIL
jgi:hypothetical protein